MSNPLKKIKVIKEIKEKYQQIETILEKLNKQIETLQNCLKDDNKVDNKVLILRREDLNENSKKLDTNDITYDCFIKAVDHSNIEFARNSLVLFIDDDGETLVLKNRYGNKGRVESRTNNAKTLRATRYAVDFSAPNDSVKDIKKFLNNLQNCYVSYYQYLNTEWCVQLTSEHSEDYIKNQFSKFNDVAVLKLQPNQKRIR